MKFILSLLVLSVGCLWASDSPLQERLIEIAKEAQQLRAGPEDAVEGKLGELIKHCEKIAPGSDAADQERLMHLSIMAELLSLSGQYDRSNESYEKAFAIQPNFGFYRKMVVNMRRKGETEAAKALVDEYRKILESNHPGEEHASRRQDLLQFVKSALTEELPVR